MRWLMGAAALGLVAACDSSNLSVDGVDLGESGGYTIEVRASEAEQTYLITDPEGRTVGARAAAGVSALIDEPRAQALAGEASPSNDEDAPEVMSLRVPGFEMTISGTEDDADGDNGQVAMRIGGGRQNIVVHADERGPGDADDRAFVRITGADAEAVREFIAEADELSPSVQAQLLGELGLE
ncbi:MAG: hypothetical protein K2X34_00815 [Hyphomonadaceae bacterium]|nr:hypothetical protein [Hyphomonadaceae bacterium]